MKHIVYHTILLAALAALASACSIGKAEGPDPTDIFALTEMDRTRIYADTITPPNNPLSPKADFAIIGVLDRCSVNNGLFPCVRSLNMTNQPYCVYALYKNNQNIRFNSPDLAGLHMADTLCVSGTISKRLANKVSYVLYELDYTTIELVSAYTSPNSENIDINNE